MSNLEFDLFWSFRSPYCYLLLDRLDHLVSRHQVTCVLRPVYPMAARDPAFFSKTNPKYRRYHTMDYLRVAEFLKMPCRRPVPDPIKMNNETNEIAADQPYIARVTRLCAAAQTRGEGFTFVNSVSRMIWNGETDNWHEGDHIRNAILQAGLDADALDALVEPDAPALDALIVENQEASFASDHWGVPLMMFEGETFYGQDRFDLLVWRLEQSGLLPRN